MLACCSTAIISTHAPTMHTSMSLNRTGSITPRIILRSRRWRPQNTATNCSIRYYSEATVWPQCTTQIFLEKTVHSCRIPTPFCFIRLSACSRRCCRWFSAFFEFRHAEYVVSSFLRRGPALGLDRNHEYYCGMKQMALKLEVVPRLSI